jgi:hypothetical protein
MAGTPNGRVHDRFREQVKAHVESGENLYKSIISNEQRRWCMGSVGNWDGSIFKIKEMGGAFDRNAINQGYEEALTKPGTVADAMATKHQSDWLAMLERAFRTRHATSIRCEVHAAGRKKGHGHKAGPIGVASRYVEDLLKQGSAAKEK